MNKNNLAIGSKKKKYDIGLGILFLVPSFVLFTMFCYYPMLKTVLTTFQVTDSLGNFIRWNGLENWKRAFADPSLRMAITNTFEYAGLVLLFTFGGAMLLAVVCAKKTKGSKIYQMLYMLPMVIAAAPVAAVWIFILRQPGGFLNSLLGTDVAWLQDTSITMVVVALVSAWSHIPGNFIVLLAGFRNVSEDLLEAATIDGAGWWTKMFKILIPLASPQIFYVLFVSIIAALKGFGTIQLLSGGGPANSTTTLMVSIYQQVSRYGQVQTGCCLALVLFAIIFIVTRIQFLFEKKFVFYQ